MTIAEQYARIASLTPEQLAAEFAKLDAQLASEPVVEQTDEEIAWAEVLAEAEYNR